MNKLYGTARPAKGRVCPLTLKFLCFSGTKTLRMLGRLPSTEIIDLSNKLESNLYPVMS